MPTGNVGTHPCLRPTLGKVRSMTRKLTRAQRQIACQSPLFSALPPDLSAILLDAAHLRELRRGQTIFHSGDIVQSIHVITEGWVTLFRIAQNGTKAVVGVMTRGQGFGEPIARRATYPVSAQTITHCEVLAVPVQAVLDLLHSHPATVLSVLSATFLQLQGLVEQIEQLKALSAPERVAEFLLELCPLAAESATVMLPYDKTLIAGRLGMKPESLSRAFLRLRDHGVRVDHSSATIASVSRLRDLVHSDAGGRSGLRAAQVVRVL